MRENRQLPHLEELQILYADTPPSRGGGSITPHSLSTAHKGFKILFNSEVVLILVLLK